MIIKTIGYGLLIAMGVLLGDWGLSLYYSKINTEESRLITFFTTAFLPYILLAFIQFFFYVNFLISANYMLMYKVFLVMGVYIATIICGFTVMTDWYRQKAFEDLVLEVTIANRGFKIDSGIYRDFKADEKRNDNVNLVYYTANKSHLMLVSEYQEQRLKNALKNNRDLSVTAQLTPILKDDRVTQYEFDQFVEWLKKYHKYKQFYLDNP